jgi:hypothetical protein
MTIEELRVRHPRFVYRSFHVENEPGYVTITFDFLIDPDIEFHPTVRIPVESPVELEMVAPYAFHLGMIEAISYWKSACPPLFVVEAGFLSMEQLRFWRDLYIHGLGEFFYRNDIDFTIKNFLTITSNGPIIQSKPTFLQKDMDLVLVGGGKDSAVTLNILTQSHRTIQTMIVNPTEAALSNLAAVGITDAIIVERTLDPALFDLTDKGYLNGHTPFSAYLAFLGITVGAIRGITTVLVSNEQSANEGNVLYRGMEINHQYSKSFRFEQMFRSYCASFLPNAPEYMSFLRPLNEVQIGMLFANCPQFFMTFRSCNVGSKTNTWCGTCPKCAFTYLSLFPSLSYETMMAIFGRDYFATPSIIHHIRGLIGLEPVKPFECVGTRAETKFLVALAVKKYADEHRPVPPGLLDIYAACSFTEADIAHLTSEIVTRWADTYSLDAAHIALLRGAWRTATTV